MASENSTRTPNAFVVFLGTAAAFGVVALVFGTTLALNKPVDEVEKKRAAQRLETRTKLDAEAQAKLGSLGWVDKAKGTVHVPIADAMKMVVADLTAKKPAASSVKVEAPLPLPVAAPNSAEPPPAALPSAPQGADTVRFAQPAAADAPAPAAPAPAALPPVTPAAPAPEKPPAPAPVPAPPPSPIPAPEKPADPAPAPAIPPPAPAPAPEPPAAPPTHPTENPEPTK